tara:strand:- start:1138 stop:1602 length:465 start_codon:yes stop_codon:yes gene_type:complete
MKYINDIYTDKAFHWLQFLKHNNLGFLRKESLNLPPHKVEQDESEEAIQTYIDINDQVISIFGIEESFLTQQEKKQDIALLKLDFIINGNKMKRTEWRIKELEIQTPEQHNKTQHDLEKEIELVSKSVGNGIIDIKNYSIHQYLIAKKSLSNGK